MATENTNNNTNSTEEVNKDEAPLIANKNKSILNQILYNIYQSSKDKTIFGNFTIEGYPNPDEKFKKEEKVFVNNIFSIGDVDTLGWGSDNQSPQVYITFGVLLAIIQTKIILHDNSKGSDTSIPLFRFDMNFNDLKNDDNYILKLPGQFSSDPRICIIPYENTIPPLPDLELKETGINTELKKSSYWNVNNEPYVGRLAALFVNIDYLTKVLDDLPLDEENNVNILDFLKGVIKGITQALGGINKINITITEDGLIRFIEEIPQRLKEIEITEGKQYARFNVFGVKPGIEGSFITSINLDAEIPSSFAATVAIGSQSNGNQKSGNATAFSNYNKGLKDRIIPEKITGTETPDPNEDEEQKDQLVENFKKIFKVGASLRTPFGAIYNAKNWFPDNIDTLTNLNTTHASLMLGRLTQPDENGNQQLQSSFFLPFNFSIEMEGLSGMVLYEKFKISEEILPPSYEKGGVDIQIKGINHTVNDKGWKTKLETQSVPAAKLSPISTPYSLNVFSGAVAGAAVVMGANTGAGGGQYQSGTGEFDIDLTRTINSTSRMAIINKFGWPILIEERGGKYYGQQKGLNAGRVVYTLSSEYKSRNSKTFTYTYKNGKTFSQTLHVGMHDALRQTLKKIDDAGFSDGVKNIDASIYARDTTNAPGLLSGHSFGVAMDFNSSVYPYGNSAFKKWEEDVKNSRSTDYKAAKAIEIAKNTGLWNWGGNYSKNKDTHHFTFKPYST